MGSIINPNEKQTWAITAQGITVMGKTKSYNTYEEMLRSPDPGLINYVTDASGDPTVHSGFAVYRYSNGIFTKIYEGEMMDPDLGMVFEWSKIVNGPTSAPADIDAAVEKTQPMEIQKDDTGRIVGLAVNGILLATEEQITELEGKTAGALHFKGVVENKEALPTEGNEQGDVYVDKEGKEYVYVDGTGFEEFGSITDLTNYYTKDEITSILATYLPLTNGVFSGLVYMEEATTPNAAQNIVVLGSNAIMNRISIGQQDPTGFDADKLYSFKYFEAGPLGMKGFVDYLKSKGVDDAITSAIRTNGVQIQDTGKKISDIPFYQTFQNANDDAPRKTIQLKNHDTISGIKTDGTGVNIAMVSKWDKVDLGTTQAQMNLNSPNGVIQVNDDAVVVTSANISEYAPATDLSGYYTKAEVDAKVAGVLSYKGTVATVEELDAIEAPAVGDVYHVTADKGEYAFNGTKWESLGSEVDLSAYAKTADVTTVIDAAKAEVAASVTAEEEARSAADTALDNRVTGLQSDLVGKVDKVEGKSLVDDAEIARLAEVENYDDTDVRGLITNVTTSLEGKVDKVAGKSLVDDAEIARLATVNNYDDTVLSTKVASAEGNVISISDRLASLEAQIVSLKQTDVAAVTSSADLAQADKDLIITIAEPITGTTTVEGKSIEVKQLTTSNATTVFKTEGDVTMKNLTTTGDLPKATANAQIRIVSGDYVRVTDSAIDQTGYNAIEIGLGTGSGPSATKSIVIDNVKFNSALTNNAISIFATEDGSVITISNCTSTKCSNPVRLSNATGGKVTINLVNCEFTEWDSSNDGAGLLIMQDYTSKSVEAIQANNLFGPDKVTINVINCTHAGEKIVAPANIAEVCGTKNAATQLFYIWSNEEGFVTYDAERYPVINIQ